MLADVGCEVVLAEEGTRALDLIRVHQPDLAFLDIRMPGDAERILAYVCGTGDINNAQYRELLGVEMHRAWYLLRRRHRANLLHQDSSGRWAHYRLP